MQDLKTRLDRLMVEATDCELIGNLSSDKDKRALFRKLATDLRAMATDVEALIAARTSWNERRDDAG